MINIFILFQRKWELGNIIQLLISSKKLVESKKILEWHYSHKILNPNQLKKERKKTGKMFQV